MFEEIAASYGEMEKQLQTAIEAMESARAELFREDAEKPEDTPDPDRQPEEEEQRENLERLLKKARNERENLYRLRKTFARIAELEKDLTRRITRFFAEDYVPYPEPEFGVSRFPGIAAHENLLPFDCTQRSTGDALEMTEIL